jgi:hypothetical protein
MKFAVVIQEAMMRADERVGQTSKNLDIQIECWPVDRLIPSDANPRTHSPEQVAQIASSIREFGFVNPILVAADGRIIPGEARLRAAQKHGMREVPVIVLPVHNDVSVQELPSRGNITPAGPEQHESRSVDLDRSERVQVELKMSVGRLDVGGGSQNLLDADFSYNVAALETRHPLPFRRIGLRSIAKLRSRQGIASISDRSRSIVLPQKVAARLMTIHTRASYNSFRFLVPSLPPLRGPSSRYLGTVLTVIVLPGPRCFFYTNVGIPAAAARIQFVFSRHTEKKSISKLSEKVIAVIISIANFDLPSRPFFRPLDNTQPQPHLANPQPLVDNYPQEELRVANVFDWFAEARNSTPILFCANDGIGMTSSTVKPCVDTKNRSRLAT